MSDLFNHIDLIVCSAEQDRWGAALARIVPERAPPGEYMGVCEMRIHHEPSGSCCRVEAWPATERRLLAKLYETKKVPFQVLGGANDGLEFRK